MGYLTPNNSNSNEAIINIDSKISTSDNQVTQNTLLGNILTAISSRYSFSETIWVDSDITPSYWVMRTYQDPDTLEINTVFTTPNGIVGIPVGTITPASKNSNIFTESIDYDVITNGTGYSIGDLITKTLVREVNGGTILETFWYNQKTDTVISNINIDYTKIEKSTETINIKSESLGNIDDVMATGEVGSFSVNSILKRISFYIKGLFDKDFATSGKQDNLLATQYLDIIITQTVNTSGTSAQSLAVNANTKTIVIKASKACWVLLGNNPTATIGGVGCIMLSDNDVSYPIKVIGGTTKIAVIQDSVSGKINIIESL